jgi:SAM-dependent methyltransferase
VAETTQPAYLAVSEERGLHMANFVQDSIRPLENLKVLDLGCRLGGISLAFAQKARQVVAIDVSYDKKRARSWKEKVGSREEVVGCASGLFFMCGDGLALPFLDNTFDLVIINGVLEWVGAIDMLQNPRDLQKRFLEEVRRVLKADGLFYLAIENRLFPGYIRKDSHTSIPLVGILPRRLADNIAWRFYHQPYRTYTYSYWGLEKLVREAGFASSRFYTPLDTYWFPYAIEPVSDRNRVLRSLDHPNLENTSDVYRQEALVSKEQRWFIKAMAWLGLTRVFCNAFVVIGRKQRPDSRSN